jgi:dTDP-glucose pyrophosphorylase
MAEPLTLVVLAAGLGSRFGGLKQLEPLGPDGSPLMDYSVYDAWRSGFGRAVFVIRPDIAEVFSRSIGSKYRGRVSVETAFQRLEDLPAGHSVPPGRTRPWGTTQAVLAARAALSGPFAVLNADDFYGQDALGAVARFLVAPGGPTRHAVVGYRLDRTVSPAGGVNRAVLERNPDGTLAKAVEVLDLVAAVGGGFRGRVGTTSAVYPPDAPVSMNLWGLQPSILPVFERGFLRFLDAGPGERDEYYLPAAIQDAIATAGATVTVLPSTGRWCGVTYPEDRDWVRDFLREEVRAGRYPATLWP